MDFVSDSGRRQGPGLARTQHYSHYLSLEGGGILKEGTLPPNCTWASVAFLRATQTE